MYVCVGGRLVGSSAAVRPSIHSIHPSTRATSVLLLRTPYTHTHTLPASHDTAATMSAVGTRPAAACAASAAGPRTGKVPVRSALASWGVSPPPGKPAVVMRRTASAMAGGLWRGPSPWGVMPAARVCGWSEKKVDRHQTHKRHNPPPKKSFGRGENA